MAIRNPTGKKYGVFAEGVDNTSPIDSNDVIGTLSVALNADIVDDSLVAKRGGYTPVNTAWGSNRIRQGLEFIKADNSQEELIYGEASSTTGTSGVLGKLNGTGVPTDIRTGLLDGVKPSIVQFRSLAFVFNGKDDFLYDGTSTRQIGITAPNTAPTFLSYVAGSKTVDGTYLVAYAYRNSTTGAQSTPSPPSAIQAAGSTGGFSMTVQPGSSTTADQIRVYSSTNGGNILLYDHDEAISNTSITLTKADSDLGKQLELDNERLPEAGTIASVLDNRVFVGGFRSNPNRIMYSKVGQDGSMPESFQAADIIDCNINDGDKVVGMGHAGSTMIVLKERSVGRLISISSPTSAPVLAGSPQYLYEEISADITGVSHHTMVSLDNIVIWLGRDDIYGTDGNQIFRFGKRIRKTIKSLNFAQSWKFSAINKTDTLQILFSVVRNGQTEPDFQIVTHYRNYPKLAYTFYSPGSDTSTHPGIQAGSLFQVTLNKEKKFYFGSSSATGLVHQFDIGTNDNTKGIYFDVRLPWDGVKNPASKKTFHSYYIFVAGGGIAPNNKLVHTWEEDAVESILKTKTDTLPGQTAFWNTGGITWSNFDWSSIKYKPLRFFPHRKAYFGRYGWNNTYADQPVAVKALATVAQMTPMHR